MSPKARRRVLLTVGKVAAEFEAVSGLSTTEGDYRSIHAPTRLIAGERTRKPARAIVDELLNILPSSDLQLVPRAGHMSPLTHPEAVSSLIAQHIEHVEARAGRMKPTTWQAESRPKRRSIA
jgi:pimeloyl-ACP methyl ester carboxylesterase